jgi:hypothetical protein
LPLGEKHDQIETHSDQQKHSPLGDRCPSWNFLHSKNFTGFTMMEHVGIHLGHHKGPLVTARGRKLAIGRNDVQRPATTASLCSTNVLGEPAGPMEEEEGMEAVQSVIPRHQRVAQKRRMRCSGIVLVLPLRLAPALFLLGLLFQISDSRSTKVFAGHASSIKQARGTSSPTRVPAQQHLCVNLAVRSRLARWLGRHPPL